MQEFLRNAHLRLVTIGDIEVHLQGLSFHAIECDEIGSADISVVLYQARHLSSTSATFPLRWGVPWGKQAFRTTGNFIIGEISVR